MKFIQDVPIETKNGDTLRLYSLVEKLKKAIEHTETPFVFGVLGDWGSGKTSILKIVQHELNNEYRDHGAVTVPIWFNAWEYENETNILYPLLYQIRRDYADRMAGSEGKAKFFECLWQVAASSTYTLADFALRAVTQKYLSDSISLQDVSEAVEKLHEKNQKLDHLLEQWTCEVEKLKTGYQELLTLYASEVARAQGKPVEQVRFVILIDDLDRCLPETVIQLLEGIKNHLSAPHCIYVMGLNPRVIYQGVRIKYNGLEINGREYLEKIINYGFYVPDPDPKELGNFAHAALDSLIDGADRAKYQGYFKILSDVLKECNFTNPRKIKRILNDYLYYLDSYPQEIHRNQYDPRNAVRFILMAEYYPDLFERFIKDPDTAQAALGKLADPNVPAGDIEKELGLSIQPLYPQLVKMQAMFKMSTRTGAMADLRAQALAVYQIIRLPG